MAWMGRRLEKGSVEVHRGEWRGRVTFPKTAARPKKLRVWFKLGPADALDERRARTITLGLGRLARDGKIDPPVKGVPLIVRQPKDAAIPDRASDGRETLKGWSNRWLASRVERGYKSVRSDESRLRTWVWPVVGALPVADLTREHVERVVELLDEAVDEDECEWKTAQNAWGVLSRMCDDMRGGKPLAIRVRKDNPAEGVSPPDRGTRKGKQFLYPSEFQRLVECDAVSIAEREVYAMAAFLYPRAGELEALHCEDVDLTHGTVHIHRALHADSGEIRETKGNRPRRIPIHPHLRPLLERLVARAGGMGLVWPEWPLWKHRAGRLRQHLELAGVRRGELHERSDTTKVMTFHDLRATGITWEAVAGTDALRIQRRAGHTSLSTTQIYMRLAEEVGIQGFGQPFPRLPSALTGEALVPAMVPQSGGGGTETGPNGTSGTSGGAIKPPSLRLDTSRYVVPGFESLSPNPNDTLAEAASEARPAPPGGPTGGPTRPALESSPRQGLVETLSRAVAEMSAAGDLAGARIALQSLNRLLGESATPAGYAGPVAADPSRKRESGS